MQIWKIDFLQKFPGKYLEDNFPGIPTYKTKLFYWQTWCNAPNLVQMAQGGCDIFVELVHRHQHFLGNSGTQTQYRRTASPATASYYPEPASARSPQLVTAKLLSLQIALSTHTQTQLDTAAGFFMAPLALDKRYSPKLTRWCLGERWKFKMKLAFSFEITTAVDNWFSFY